MKSHIKAFTLIELLVVIAIIAVLTGVVLAQFSTAKAKARDAKRVTDIAQLQLGIQLYFDRCNQYPSATATGPSSVPDLASSIGCPTGVTLATFMSQIPTPPITSGFDTSYRYMVHTTSGINDDYYLAARLENSNRALEDDLDGTLPTATSGWSGWTAGGGTFASFSFDDAAGNYIYGVGAK